jgi:nitrate/nitrite transport system substrate-binding protein
MWFLTQHKRWGLLKDDVDYLAVARSINRIDLYKDAAAMAKASVPKDSMRSSKLVDGVVWDGKNPKAYAASFKIRA